MTLRMHDPLVHDHTESELVLIGKNALAEHIAESKSTATVGGAAFALLGIATVVLGTVFLAGDFHDIGPMSGPAVRAFILGLGVAGILLGIHLMVSWLDRRDNHSPGAIIERLTTADPRRLGDIRISLGDLQVPGSKLPRSKPDKA